MGKDVAVLDIGSNKLVFAVGRKTSTEYVINYLSDIPYFGYYDGEFIKPENLYEDIAAAIKESNAPKLPKTLYVGVPSEFLKVEINSYLVNFNREKLITNSIINDIHSRGDNYNTYNDWVLFSSAALKYVLDDQITVTNPYNRRATNISATISYMYVNRNFEKLIYDIALSLGFENVKYIASSWAVGNKFIAEENRNLGALNLDVGFGSTSLAIMKGEGVASLTTAPLGTGSIFGTLAQQLNVEFEDALQLEQIVNLNHQIIDTSTYALTISDKIKNYKVKDINNAIKSRLGDIINFVNDSISNAELGLVSETTPIYLSGGAIPSIKGAFTYLEQQFKRRIMIVVVEAPKYNKPCYTSLFALLDAACEINENISIWNKLFG